jgi:GH24 family phage-related lysozyme (muramidase)
VSLYAVVISTKTKAREFKFDELADARGAANDLWRWAKSNDEHGTITLYERRETEWSMIQHEKV